jgi:hypothetical protein
MKVIRLVRVDRSFGVVPFGVSVWLLAPQFGKSDCGAF